MFVQLAEKVMLQLGLQLFLVFYPKATPACERQAGWARPQEAGPMGMKIALSNWGPTVGDDPESHSRTPALWYSIPTPFRAASLHTRHHPCRFTQGTGLD